MRQLLAFPFWMVHPAPGPLPTVVGMIACGIALVNEAGDESWVCNQ